MQHWDNDLAQMAENWVYQCRFDNKDPCNFVYQPRYSVGQAWTFIKRAPRKRWVQEAIQYWFRESINIYETDIDALSAQKANNFTQVIWSESKFVGCAAARMFDGHLINCYYHPEGNLAGGRVLERGDNPEDICSDCDVRRSSCSRILNGLCGLGKRKYIQIQGH